MRLLHITDLHILGEPKAALYGVDTFAALQRVLAKVFSTNPRPDYIVATGDLSEDATEASYIRLRALLLETGVPVFVIPGNHDDVARMNAHLIGGLITMDFVSKLPIWKVMLLNSQVPGHSHGHISPTQIDALEHQLEADKGAPHLIALHHAPIAHCPDADCQLENTDALLSTVRRFLNVKAIISGHAHVSSDEDCSHIKVMTTPATSLQVMHPKNPTPTTTGNDETHILDSLRHGFRIIDLGMDGEIQTMVYYIEDSQP
jgi:3',5'-cyclic-AMP phosphodiesterase